MLDAAVRIRCQELLSQLPLPEPFDLDVFCHELALRRRRPLRVCDMPPGPQELNGAWLATDEADYVFVDGQARPLHRQHIVLHELAHIVCGHGDAAAITASDAQALLPELDSEMVARVLGRSRYSQVQEREAELLATMIGQRARRGPERADQQDGPGGQDVQALRRRLRSALG